MLSSLKQLWQILTPLDKRKLLLVLLLVILMAFIEAAGVVSIMPFLAVLTNSDIVHSNSILNQLYHWLVVPNIQQFIVCLGIVSLGIVIFSTIFKVLTQYALYRFANLQRHYFSTRLLSIYLEQPYEFFLTHNSSILIKNVLSEVDELVRNIIQPFLFLIAYSIVIFAMILILLIYNPIMAISTALILIVFYMIIFTVVKNLLHRTGQDFVAANTQRYQACNEVFGGIKDIKITNSAAQYIEYIEQSSRTYSLHAATREVLGQVPLHIIETIGYSCIIILALVLVLSGKDVATILPILGLYGIAAYRMLPSAQIVYRSMTAIKFSHHVFSIIKQELNLEKRKTNQYEQIKSLQFNHTIELKDICFAYSNRPECWVLQNFNLTIAKNSSIGIVGKSGSGKSTLMDIMLGLLQPQSGKILIDGIELNEQNMTAWHGIVGYVPQSIYLADKTIAENIAFGFITDQIDMQQVEFVSKQAQVHDFITKQLPQGYSTIVGERGVMLSGGQRQRIGIARALYRNPQVLFMDEATSALDVETEQAVNEAIQHLSGQKTMVIIAHRESAVMACTSILKIPN
ncbi:ABC transporter ATP-binding protein [Acinetobacter junii]|uniref:ABC transporter ATP-binding protein n=1 Tax=Acinetobacter junii TaxID=40215 RepID=UPI00124FCAA2|nr:ATP-binding cassette domain-containing protein [Acinetobacter junii]MDH0718435.1 ATP-binding cassette domain-containing protein [Acinetobacter junii]